MKVVVIPARGGSKRIPRKNIKMFHGKPMMAWSIEAARQSGCFDAVVVSTDDAEIAEVARAYGAEVPFMRPAALADDYAGTIPVMQHALKWFAEQGQEIEALCCLYATAPFVRAADLQAALSTFEQAGVDYVFSATTYAFPIQRALMLTPQGRVQMFQPEHLHTRSQDLPEAWHDAGQFYWGKAAAWQAGRPVFSEQAAIYPLPRQRVQDIDTPEDWARAELLFALLQQEPA